MKRKIECFFIALFALLTTTTPLMADRVSHYVPGVATYGASSRVYECGRCGKSFQSGSGHVCTYDDGRSHRSGSGREYEASDAEADAVIAADPSLQINNTYMTPWTPEAPSSADKEDEGNTLNIVLSILAVGGLLVYIYRKKLRK